MIVAEAVGFAATHTISAILDGLPDHEVAHGTQDFETKRPVGRARQSPGAFAASMAAVAESGQRPVAVHTLFPPAEMKPACEARGILYRLLVRAPDRQIESCYAWVLAKVLAGEAVMGAALTVSLPLLPKLELQPTLPNILYLFAAHQVMAYNGAALAVGAQSVRIEDLLADEAAFRALFEVPEDISIGHFAGRPVALASHRAKVAPGTLADPDRTAILERLTVDVAGMPIGYPAYRAALGY